MTLFMAGIAFPVGNRSCAQLALYDVIQVDFRSWRLPFRRRGPHHELAVATRPHYTFVKIGTFISARHSLVERLRKNVFRHRIVVIALWCQLVLIVGMFRLQNLQP